MNLREGGQCKNFFGTLKPSDALQTDMPSKGPKPAEAAIHTREPVRDLDMKVQNKGLPSSHFAISRPCVSISPAGRWDRPTGDNSQFLRRSVMRGGLLLTQRGFRGSCSACPREDPGL
jgi:hypothetical protein